MRIKYLILPIISLGFILSGIVEIEFNSDSNEWLPTFYASPVVYKMKSPVTSLSYYYSVFGLLANMVIWSLVLFIIHKLLEGILTSNVLKKAHQLLIIILLIISCIIIVYQTITISSGFYKSTNWYWNMDEIANERGAEYHGILKLNFM